MAPSAVIGRRELSTTPPRYEKLKAESILYDICEIPDNMRKETIEAECADRLMAKKDEAAISRDDENGLIRWGNPAGLSILDRLNILEENDRSKDDRIKELELDRDTTQVELQDLKAVNDAYLDIRNRFFSVYVRDKEPHSITDQDRKNIREGDRAAHRGDPFTDAIVYKNNIRTDVSTFKTLYGVSPQLVLDYLSSDDKNVLKTLAVLGRHATVKADKMLYLPTATFFSNFTKFVDAWESGGFRTHHLSNRRSRMAKAYRSFWDEYHRMPRKPKEHEAGDG